MEVEILHSYLHCQTSVVELPKDKTTDDIKDVWIKWSEGHLEFKDESILPFKADFDFDPDYKRPYDIEIYVDGAHINLSDEVH
jgi:hypothetical protein